MPEQHRTHIIIPADLASEIDAVVGKRGRSKFFAEAARRELSRLQLEQALKKVVGSWEDKDHPELQAGSSQWVAQLRTIEEITAAS